MSDTGVDTAQRSWPPPADALYSDRIKLFQRDSEQYFVQYPRVGYVQLEKNNSSVTSYVMR